MSPRPSVEVVGERDRDRHRRDRLALLAVGPVDAGDPRARAGGQHDDLVAAPQRPGGDLAGVEALTSGRSVGCGRITHWTGRRAGRSASDAASGTFSRCVSSGSPAYQPMCSERSTTLSPFSAEIGDERHAVQVKARGPVQEVAHDAVEGLLAPAGEVHLVDADGDVAHPQQPRDGGVAARLLGHPVADVDEDQRQVGGRAPCDHVARVLRVARAVGDQEAPPRGGEGAVGDVDRDALLALGAQAVGDQREVDVAVAAPPRRLLDVLELVGEQRLGVVQQPADQRRLAVVDGAGGREAQEAGHQWRPSPGIRSSPRACGLPWRPRSRDRRRASRRAR